MVIEETNNMTKKIKQSKNYADLYKEANRVRVCVICKQAYNGWGNNAMPVKRGRCCDICNMAVVIARMYQLRNRDK
jgi:hypothetical protein